MKIVDLRPFAGSMTSLELDTFAAMQDAIAAVRTSLVESGCFALLCTDAQYGDSLEKLLVYNNMPVISRETLAELRDEVEAAPHSGPGSYCSDNYGLAVLIRRGGCLMLVFDKAQRATAAIVAEAAAAFDELDTASPAEINRVGTICSQWPAGNQPVSRPATLVAALKDAFLQGADWKRKNAERDIEWRGPETVRGGGAYAWVLSAANLRQSLEDQDRDFLEELLYIALQLGIEQGRRLELKDLDHIFRQIRRLQGERMTRLLAALPPDEALSLMREELGDLGRFLEGISSGAADITMEEDSCSA